MTIRTGLLPEVEPRPASKRRMNAPEVEMRLCWSHEVCHLAHEIQRANEWQPMHQSELADLEIMVSVGNEIYGPETHWIETRQGGSGS